MWSLRLKLHEVLGPWTAVFHNMPFKHVTMIKRNIYEDLKQKFEYRLHFIHRHIGKHRLILKISGSNY